MEPSGFRFNLHEGFCVLASALLQSQLSKM